MRFRPLVVVATTAAALVAAASPVFADTLTVQGTVSPSDVQPGDTFTVTETVRNDDFGSILGPTVRVLGKDAPISPEILDLRFNADLANGLGNLVSRATKMVELYCDGRVPVAGQGGPSEKALRDLRQLPLDERLQRGWLVAHEKAAHEKEQLRLALVQVAHGVDEHAHVALLPAHGRSWRVLPGRHKMDAVGRTLNLHEPLGAAADRADLLCERRTRPPRLCLAAERTNHTGIIV